MQKRFFLILSCSIAVCLSILAHEFWLEPSRTKVKVGEPVSLNLLVGEYFAGARWEGKGDRVIRYKHFYNGGAYDLLNSIKPEVITQLLDFTPVTEGTHMIILVTNSSFIELAPADFEAYLAEEGLKDALEYRQQHHENEKPGRELYRRCTKVLIQAGEETDQTSKQATSMALDIIPQENPYELKEGKELEFKILYDGKPLPDALVRCWYKNEMAFNVEIQNTSKKGEVSFLQQGEGRYMISVVHMVPIENDPQADWQSTWGSLVFGMEN